MPTTFQETRSRFFSDYVTRLFSPASLKRLEQVIGTRDVGLVTLQIEDFYTLVGAYGEEAGFALLEVLAQAAEQDFSCFFPDCEFLCAESGKLNEIILCFVLCPGGIDSLPQWALSFLVNLKNRVNESVGAVTGQPVDVCLGHSWICRDQKKGFYKVLFKAFCDARRVATSKLSEDTLTLHHEFVQILEKGLLECSYQPIMDFESSRVLGWEAFVRGPAEGAFREPGMLFGYAEQIGKVYTLDRECRKIAIKDLGPVDPDQLLFMNIHLQTLNDPDFTPGSTLRLIQEHGLVPENVVLEFSEGHGIQDYRLLLENLELYRSQGFAVAIDDAGAGHSSLRSISQIKPDYIKIDMSLIRGIDFNPIKRVMAESFVTLSEKVGSRVIAVGIETETELSCLAGMGVHYGQGFYIARPASPKPLVSVSAPSRASLSRAKSGDLKCSTPVLALVQPAVCVSADATVEGVKQRLADSPPMSSVVVEKDNRPVGLLMNYNLDRALGTRFGVSLFYHRPVSRLMDSNPLVVEKSEAVEEVAKMAMNRDDQKIYDDIIVTDADRIMGTISVQKMLDTLAKVQVEMAKGANPLTGLPGNVAIEREISRRANAGQPSSLLYVDLDNFKVYNDVYGFDKGDRLILFTARIVTEAAANVGRTSDFVGHVGGDDFMVICDQDTVEDIAADLVGRFAEGVGQMYSAEDREKGYVVGTGRDGTERRFPLVTISVGIVDCDFVTAFTMDELSQRVAEIKRYAKARPGNSFVRDRRAPIGADPNSPKPRDQASR